MRIVLLTAYALPHLGGVEVVVDATARELRRRGHDVAIVASSASHASPAATVDHDGRNGIIRVPASNAAEDRLGVPWPVFGPSLATVVRRAVADADVVHAHGMLYPTSWAGMTLARSSRAVRVLTEHVGYVDYESRLVGRVEELAIAAAGRFALRSSHGVVVLNETVRGLAAHLAPSRPIRLIGNGVDLETYRPASHVERQALRDRYGWDEKPRVLFVGRMVAKKGLDIALEAAEGSADRFELVLVGPGTVPDRLPANVRVLGALEPARMPGLYRAADAFVLPSRGEGFPVAAQEAMASGLPVVLADDPNYEPHLLGAGPGAVTVSREAAAVRAALNRLLGDDGSRALAGESARRHAELRFSWKESVDRLLGFYADLAAGGPEVRERRPA